MDGRKREGPKLLLNHGPSEPCYTTAYELPRRHSQCQCRSSFSSSPTSTAQHQLCTILSIYDEIESLVRHQSTSQPTNSFEFCKGHFGLKSYDVGAFPRPLKVVTSAAIQSFSLDVIAHVNMVTLTFGLLTVKLVCNFTRGTDNLPAKFGACVTLLCQVIVKHASH